jgi:hypothetical protein
MTLKTTKGTSLSKVFHGEKKRMAWIAKLHGNCRKLLDKLGNILTLDPVSLKGEAANSNTITLRFSGLSEDLARIERILDVRFVKGQAEVKFSRTTIIVKLLKTAEAVKVAA